MPLKIETFEGYSWYFACKTLSYPTPFSSFLLCDAIWLLPASFFAASPTLFLFLSAIVDTRCEPRRPKSNELFLFILILVFCFSNLLPPPLFGFVVPFLLLCFSDFPRTVLNFWLSPQTPLSGFPLKPLCLTPPLAVLILFYIIFNCSLAFFVFLTFVSV